MSEKLKVGIIGAGRIGRLHADHLSRRIETAELTAVSDVYEDAAKACAEELGIRNTYTDYRRILEDRDIEAVVICSSTDTHAGIIMDAASAGKHIFCEKPIALDLNALDAALKAADRAGVVLQIGFNRRFDTNYHRIREHIVQGDIGDLHFLHLFSRDPAPPPIEYVRISGGIFLDMMIHDFDMARFLSGSEVEEVYTLGAVRIDESIGEAGDVDTALVSLKFRNGVIGTIDNSRKAVYGYDQRVEVFGSKGMAMSGNNYPNSVFLCNGHECRRDLPLNFFMDRYIDSYIEEMRVFIDTLQNGGISQVDGNDGRMPVVMGKAAGKSLQEHRPVRIEEIEGPDNTDT